MVLDYSLEEREERRVWEVRGVNKMKEVILVIKNGIKTLEVKK